LIESGLCILLVGLFSLRHFLTRRRTGSARVLDLLDLFDPVFLIISNSIYFSAPR
jgi:hypothetical protein